jgi:hypothetical protein
MRDGLDFGFLDVVILSGETFGYDVILGPH